MTATAPAPPEEYQTHTFVVPDEQTMQYWESLIGTGRYPGHNGEVWYYPQNWPKDKPMPEDMKAWIPEHPECGYRLEGDRLVAIQNEE
ncbi:hypothetical protein JS533_000815 [Bifidobacterium amazonense]|uniref:Glyoxalase n=1 Tax=Bifidobacterium amazonense TaxID=2809027 RepID=A0ABS9VRW2_9BIFI|nr:hypothetical protein [Bifidobacterium amazonense]MCH9274832.1 hypothetical protein [Bifidobacterium amazonense]